LVILHFFVYVVFVQVFNISFHQRVVGSTCASDSLLTDDVMTRELAIHPSTTRDKASRNATRELCAAPNDHFTNRDSSLSPKLERRSTYAGKLHHDVKTETSNEELVPAYPALQNDSIPHATPQLNISNFQKFSYTLFKLYNHPKLPSHHHNASSSRSPSIWRVPGHTFQAFLWYVPRMVELF
jgi:hypothetical protein